MGHNGRKRRAKNEWTKAYAKFIADARAKGPAISFIKIDAGANRLTNPPVGNRSILAHCWYVSCICHSSSPACGLLRQLPLLKEEPWASRASA